MSEITTVTHDGNIYQIGKQYSFSDDGSNWTISSLKSISYASDFPFRSGFSWRLIKEFESSDVGTITPAPIKLVDGAAYMFDVRENTFLGFYRERRKSFFYEIINGNKIAGASEATNIRLMTVGSK
jgi:hypothetical protein